MDLSSKVNFYHEWEFKKITKITENHIKNKDNDALEKTLEDFFDYFFKKVVRFFIVIHIWKNSFGRTFINPDEKIDLLEGTIQPLDQLSKFCFLTEDTEVIFFKDLFRKSFIPWQIKVDEFVNIVLKNKKLWS